jgi:hypothetical protein
VLNLLAVEAFLSSFLVVLSSVEFYRGCIAFLHIGLELLLSCTMEVISILSSFFHLLFVQTVINKDSSLGKVVQVVSSVFFADFVFDVVM